MSAYDIVDYSRAADMKVGSGIGGMAAAMRVGAHIRGAAEAGNAARRDG